MTTNNNQTFIEVIETQKVKYRKESFLFFSWFVRISAYKIKKDIFISTNDDIDNIFFNDQFINLKK